MSMILLRVGRAAVSRACLLGASLLLITGPVVAQPPVGQPAPRPQMPPAKTALAKRGEYVATAADCMSCHTAPSGPPFAGGDPLKSAFGTIYGSNITPDPQTGIGNWSKSDFERALRLGVRKDGDYLYPAMPYQNYTKMTAADMDALWEYIHNVPAVNHTIPKNTLPFPLNVRSGMAVWQAVYFKPGPFQPTPTKDATWNRGAYLVDALAHCNQCHTPRNLAQGFKSGHALTGAAIEGWYAPNISSDSLSVMHDWSVAQLQKFLKTGALPDNTKTFGPMQEVVHDSLHYLTSADLAAMADYLKDQPGSAAPLRASRAGVSAQELAHGKLIYENNCTGCHQSDGKGKSANIPALAGNSALTAAEPSNVIMALLEGFPPQGTWGAMGSFANSLSDADIADVTNYVRTAWGNDGAPNASPWMVGNWRRNATAAPASETHALLCPNLPADVLQPALAVSPATLKSAATDHGQMARLVGTYSSAKPKASTADVIEALSTAYCRAVAPDHISEARMSAQIADFAQQVAVALNDHTPPT